MRSPTPDREKKLQAYDQTSVAIAGVLRLAYLIHRFYGTEADDSVTEFQVNLIRYISFKSSPPRFPISYPLLITNAVSVRLNSMSLCSAAASLPSNPSCANTCRACCDSAAMPPVEETAAMPPIETIAARIRHYRLWMPRCGDRSGESGPATRTS